jgi:hypothetical protein
VNGPSDITITDIELELTYYHPVGFFGVQQVKVYFNDVAILQKELRLSGPGPRGVRMKPYDLVVWRFPRWDRLLCDGEGLAYRFKIKTAHTDRPTYSDVRQFGSRLKTIFSSIHTKPRITSSGGLSFISRNPNIPTEMRNWAQAVLRHAHGIGE